MKGGMPKVNDARKALSHQLGLVCLGMLAGVTWLTVAVATLSADDTVAVVSAKPVNTICGSGCSPLSCPDDYTRKPIPCVLKVTCCCPDDYCVKPRPAVPCHEACCCPDDYCAKPPPACRPWAHTFYKCVPLPQCSWLRPTARKNSN